MRNPRFFFLFTLFSVLVGCTSNPLDVDVSDVKVELEVTRLDQKIFTASASELQKVHQENLTKLGSFYETYYQQMLGLGPAHAPTAAINLQQFATDPVMQEVHTLVDQKFPNTDGEEEALKKAFTYYHHYFPEKIVPSIAFYQTGFYAGVFPTDSVLGISLEMYLGPDEEVVKRLSPMDYPQYLKDKMDPQYIPIDAMFVWISNAMFSPEAYGNTFLSRVIYNGKMMYLLEALMPETSEQLRMKYSDEELAWCETNSRNIWKEVLDQQLLHSKDGMKIDHWIREAPFTKGLPDDSPPRVGLWLGLQIVKRFHQAHPELTLNQVLEEQNHQKIVNYYKPKK